MQDDTLIQMTFRKDGLAYLIDAVQSFRSGLNTFYEKNPAYWNPFRNEIFDGIMDKVEKADAATQITFSGIEVQYLHRVISVAMVLWEGQDEERSTALKAIANELDRLCA